MKLGSTTVILNWNKNDYSILRLVVQFGTAEVRTIGKKYYVSSFIGILLIDYFEKDETINSAYISKVLNPLNEDTTVKIVSLEKEKIILQIMDPYMKVLNWINQSTNCWNIYRIHQISLLTTTTSIQTPNNLFVDSDFHRKEATQSWNNILKGFQKIIT